MRRRLNLGYLVHTNREFGLMLRGLKPLASFVMISGEEPAALIQYLRLFDRHTAQGRFLRKERTDSPNFEPLLRILYALPGEEWRIDAMLQLYDERRGWTVEGERREGFLLGYAEWETDICLDHLRQKRIL